MVSGKSRRAAGGARKRYIVGLMSGTSVDGIDAALVEISGRMPRVAARVLHHHERKWPAQIRRQILAAMAPATTTTQEICRLNHVIAEQFAVAALGCLGKANFPASRVNALASHGQTVCHLPPAASRRKTLRTRSGSTLQLGDPSVIAALTGIPTVADFRNADMALGGQGAPLVPFADDIFLAHPTHTRCVQNIGGIANVTYLPSRQRRPETWTFFTPASVTTKNLLVRPDVLAFDTGPGNMILDAVVARATRGRQGFDKNGRLAAKGTLNYPLFRTLQAHPYFSQKPPKSTGRELFGEAFARALYRKHVETGKLKVEDLLATLTHLTAWSIADAYLQFLPDLPREVILCGGGADNPTLVSLLSNYLSALRPPGVIPLRRIDDFGIPNKSKEAASFALLADATLDGIPGNLPSVTGASRPAVLGVIARP